MSFPPPMPGGPRLAPSALVPPPHLPHQHQYQRATSPAPNTPYHPHHPHYQQQQHQYTQPANAPMPSHSHSQHHTRAPGVDGGPGFLGLSLDQQGESLGSKKRKQRRTPSVNAGGFPLTTTSAPVWNAPRVTSSPSHSHAHGPAATSPALPPVDQFQFTAGAQHSTSSPELGTSSGLHHLAHTHAHHHAHSQSQNPSQSQYLHPQLASILNNTQHSNPSLMLDLHLASSMPAPVTPSPSSGSNGAMGSATLQRSLDLLRSTTGPAVNPQQNPLASPSMSGGGGIDAPWNSVMSTLLTPNLSHLSLPPTQQQQQQQPQQPPSYPSHYGSPLFHNQPLSISAVSAETPLSAALNELRSSADTIASALQSAESETPFDWLQSTIGQLQNETSRLVAPHMHTQIQPHTLRPTLRSASSSPVVSASTSSALSSTNSTPRSPRSASTDSSPTLGQFRSLPLPLPSTATLSRSASSSLPVTSTASSLQSHHSYGHSQHATNTPPVQTRRSSISASTPLSSSSLSSTTSSPMVSAALPALSALSNPMMANLPSCVLALDGQFRDANPSFLALFGFASLAALLSHSIFVVLHPSHYMELMVTMRRLVTGRAKCLAHERLCVDMRDRRPHRMWIFMSAIPHGSSDRAQAFFCAFSPAPDAEDTALDDREREEIRVELESRALLSSSQHELQEELARLEKLYEQQLTALQHQQQKHGITQQMIEQFAKKIKEAPDTAAATPASSANARSVRGRRSASGSSRGELGLGLPNLTHPIAGVSKSQSLQLAQLHAANTELKALQDMHARKLAHFMALLARQTPLRDAFTALTRSSAGTPNSSTNTLINSSSSNINAASNAASDSSSPASQLTELTNTRAASDSAAMTWHSHS